MFDRDEFTGRLRRAGFTEVAQEIHGLAQYVSATAPGGAPGATLGSP